MVNSHAFDDGDDNAYAFIGFGDCDTQELYEFIGCGGGGVQNPYELTRLLKSVRRER